MTERLKHLLPLLFITAVALALFTGPLARREVLTVRDHHDYFVPMRFFTAAHLRTWSLPLWNPYSASGEPWMANPQTAVFYPPAWMFIALPFRTAYVLFLALHLALLGCGAYLLFARIASSGAAIVGAVALMLCGPVLSMLDVGDNLASFAWLPLVAWCALSPEPRTRRVLAAIALALCFLAGEPFVATVAAVMYVVIVHRIGDVFATGAMTIGLSAIQLLPFLELVHGSDRTGGTAAADILRNSMPVSEWWRLAMPPRATGALSQQFIPVVYVGVVTAALAIVGVFSGLRHKRIVLFSALALLAVSVVVAAGPSILVHLPLTILRYPARMVPFGAFALVTLAVIGWDRLRNGRMWLDALVIVVLAADLVSASLPLLRSGAMPQIPYDRAFGRDAKIVRIGGASGLMRGESSESWIGGYLNLLDRRFDAWTASPLTSQRYADLYARALADRRLLMRIGAGYVLSSAPLAGQGIVPLEKIQSVYATKLSDALPMARLIAPDGSVTGTRAVAFDSSHAWVIVDSAQGGLVVLTQRVAPGWRVDVDGVRAPALTADGVFRAVRVSSGHHEVRWTFLPMSFIIGALITIVSIAMMIVVTRLR